MIRHVLHCILPLILSYPRPVLSADLIWATYMAGSAFAQIVVICSPDQLTSIALVAEINMIPCSGKCQLSKMDGAKAASKRASCFQMCLQ